MSETPSFEQLLKDAVSQPGKVSTAFQMFHTYSLGNQLLALFQCAERGISPGPIATYKGWQKMNRQVRRGEKALSLCMPVTCKTAAASHDHQDGGESEAGVFTRFIYRPNWFVMSQTDGDSVPVLARPDFSIEQAIERLNITRIPFDLLNGNVQGFAKNRSIAISPVADTPALTTFHEIAHIVLGHTGEGECTDAERPARNIREVEAESVALLCVASLDLPGVEFARGYIQHWLDGRGEIPEKSARKIFNAANQILVAGRLGQQSELEFTN